MKSEDIKIIVETLLKEKLAAVNDRINNLESLQKKFKEQLTQIQNSQMKKIEQQYLNLEKKFDEIEKGIKEAQTQAMEVLEKTDKKIMETKKIKTDQDEALKQLRDQITISESIRAMSANLQQLAQSSSTISTIQTEASSASQRSAPAQQIGQNSNQQFQQYQQCQQSQQIVYQTQTGKKFHQKGCEWLKYLTMPLSRDQALLMGLEECKVCKSYRR